MPIFLTKLQHAPGQCAAFNAKARQMALAAMSKAEELMKKHGAKGIGLWSVPTEHVIYWIIEASYEAFQQLGMEPEVIALSEFNVSKITEHINAKAFELLERHPEGLRWSDLLSQIKASDSTFHPKTVNGCV
jgi:hypothetical protein